MAAEPPPDLVFTCPSCHREFIIRDLRPVAPGAAVNAGLLTKSLSCPSCGAEWRLSWRAEAVRQQLPQTLTLEWDDYA